ncbi:hypothetical protein MD484_g6463, partial [Candolleomyces efflorescens]
MASESESVEVHALAAMVGRRILTNASFNNRVADLDNGDGTPYLIGWKPHGGRNQLFNFEPQGGKRTKLSTSARGGKAYYVSSPDPEPGSHLKGTTGGVGSIYTIVDHAPQQIKLSILSSEGTAPLYWTLTSDDQGTKITLEHDNGSENQVWGAVEPDD